MSYQKQSSKTARASMGVFELFTFRSAHRKVRQSAHIDIEDYEVPRLSITIHTPTSSVTRLSKQPNSPGSAEDDDPMQGGFLRRSSILSPTLTRGLAAIRKSPNESFIQTAQDRIPSAMRGERERAALLPQPALPIETPRHLSEPSLPQSEPTQCIRSCGTPEPYLDAGCSRSRYDSISEQRRRGLAKWL